MKSVYIEKWERETVFHGELIKLDIEKLAEQLEEPEILKMNEDEFKDWLFENLWEIDLDELEEDTTTMVLKGENYSDPDIDHSIYTNNQDLLDSKHTWRGFYKALGCKEVDEFKETIKIKE